MQNGTPGTFPRWTAAAIAAGMIGLLILGAWFYRARENHFRGEVNEKLAAIGRLKAEQIAKWREDRVADAAVLTDSPSLVRDIVRFLTNPADRNTEEAIRTRFDSFKKYYGYADVLLVDRQGKVHLSQNGVADIRQDEVRSWLHAAFSGDTPLIGELHSDPAFPSPHIGVISPVVSGSGPDRQAVGAIIFLSNAS